MSALDTAHLNVEEIRKLEREILASRGDLLFARAIILCEGETEEQALSIFWEHHFGRSVHEYGSCFVGVGGKDNYLPFLRLASSLEIPWYIFSDGEQEAIDVHTRNFAEINLSDAQEIGRRLKIIPNGEDYENYLITCGYQPEAERALASTSHPGPIDDYISTKHGQRKKKGLVRDYQSDGGRERAVRDALGGKLTKPKMAPLVAKEILKNPDPSKRLPPLVAALFQQIQADLGMSVP